MQKEEPDAESQKQRERLYVGQNNPTGSRRRKLPSGVAPDTLRVLRGGALNEFPGRLNSNIISAIQQLREASREKSHIVYNFQTLLNLIERKSK